MNRSDRWTWIVPFIPGALLGALIGMRSAVATHDPLVFWGATAAGALIVGAIAARYGWEFWEAVATFGRWGRP